MSQCEGVRSYMEVCIGRNRFSDAKVGPPSQQGAPLDLPPSHCNNLFLSLLYCFQPICHYSLLSSTVCSEVLHPGGKR